MKKYSHMLEPMYSSLQTSESERPCFMTLCQTFLCLSKWKTKIKHSGRKGKGETEDSGFCYRGLKENPSQRVTHSLHRNQCCFGDGHDKLMNLVIVDVGWILQIALKWNRTFIAVMLLATSWAEYYTHMNSNLLQYFKLLLLMLSANLLFSFGITCTAV
jgi:hypothetical protein